MSLNPIVLRFWSKVQKTDTCWLWQGYRIKGGYGRFSKGQIDRRQRLMLAHRMVWELTFGAIPPDVDVLHHCDNPSCVRPDHLFLGDDKDNALDRDKKMRGHWYHGEDHHKAILTESEVNDIRQALANGQTVRSLSRQYSVNSGTISCIKNGKSWFYQHKEAVK